MSYLRDPTGFLTHLARTHGDIASFRLGNRLMVQLNHPDLIRDVLNRDYEKVKKTGALVRAKTILGNGLVTSEGEFHHRQKRLAQPAFSNSALASYAALMPRAVLDVTDQWKTGQAIDIGEEMARMALNIAGRTLFGADFSRQADEIHKAVETLLSYFDRLLNPVSALWTRLPLRSNARYKQSLVLINRIVDNLIQERLRAPGRGKDLVGRYLESIKGTADGKDADLRQVREELVTLLLAGHETVATALTWTWTLLAENPKVAGRFHEEIRDVFCDGPIDPSRLDQLSYLDAVLKESMRLMPPVWGMPRELMSEYVVGPYTLPAGTILCLTQFVTHRDPRFWRDPLRFTPERWQTDDEATRETYRYFPFGGGPRRCIGAGFATMEMKIILAQLGQRFRFRLVPGQRIGVRPFLTLRPSRPIHMSVERREIASQRLSAALHF